mmetsp:Transcript_9864/g.21245  ORF Transcript_9864/g.21245 Transcript_9864/m.21245 type:complete len:201 (+) Transcript_9864:1866-2468(+)
MDTSSLKRRRRSHESYGLSAVTGLVRGVTNSLRYDPRDSVHQGVQRYRPFVRPAVGTSHPPCRGSGENHGQSGSGNLRKRSHGFACCVRLRSATRQTNLCDLRNQCRYGSLQDVLPGPVLLRKRYSPRKVRARPVQGGHPDKIRHQCRWPQTKKGRAHGGRKHTSDQFTYRRAGQMFGRWNGSVLFPPASAGVGKGSCGR